MEWEPLEELGGWVFLPPQAVPPRWRHRAVPLSLVPLLPEEARRVLGDGVPVPSVDPEEERLLSLLAGGLSVPSIAKEVGIARRSVQRRLARLRRRFGVRSNAELRTRLAGLGFGLGGGEEDDANRT